MQRKIEWLALLSLLLFVQSSQAQEDAVNVFRQVGPSVVRLHNEASTGTGVILTKGGTILTNAHVVSNPLPFECTAEVMKDGTRQTVVFKNVKVTKVHKDLDLALVQIDPAEHNAQLGPCRLSKEKAITGQRLYAIGNPATGSEITLNKTITEGLLSGVDRDIEGAKYYQISAAINPGNSGGPLSDRTGNVVGIVTLKLTDVDNVGFAIPLYDITMADFEPYSRKTIDAAKALALLKRAERLIEEVRIQSNKENRGEAEQSLEMALLRAILFQNCQEAAYLDPNNEEVFNQLGLICFLAQSFPACQAYMQESIRLDPYGKATPYELLYKSLIKQGREDKSMVVRMEAMVKFAHDPLFWNETGVMLVAKGFIKEGVYCFIQGGVVAKVKGDRVWEPKLRQNMIKYAGVLSQEERDSLIVPDAKVLENVNRIKKIMKDAYDAKQGATTAAFAQFIEEETGEKMEFSTKRIRLFALLPPAEEELAEARLAQLRGSFDTAIQLADKATETSSDKKIRRGALLVKAGALQDQGFSLAKEPGQDAESNQSFYECAKAYREFRDQYGPLNDLERNKVSLAIYNEACTYGLEKNSNKALASLREAFQNGYRNVNATLNDEDFGDLRYTPEFKALVKEFSR